MFVKLIYLFSLFTIGSQVLFVLTGHPKLADLLVTIGYIGLVIGWVADQWFDEKK